MPRSPRRSFQRTAAGIFALAVLGGCSSGTSNNEPADNTTTDVAGAASETNASARSGDDPVVIGFSAPAATHGWMGAVTTNALAEAAKYPDIELRAAESTNDVNVQISQIESFINDGVDVIVILPFDGDALTEVAIKAMEAGIPVVNVDREFASPFAARTTVYGDNYGMGVTAGTYICEQLADQPDAIVAEIPGIDSLALTQDRSAGFAVALSDCGLEVDHRVVADFTVQGGEAATSNLLQAAPHIDAIWNHDDDQGIGVLAAIEATGRDEFFMVGGAGSSNMMAELQNPDSVLKATVIYSPMMSADGIRVARLLGLGDGMEDLASVGVPRTVQLHAPLVTADNVDQYLPIGFES